MKNNYESLNSHKMAFKLQECHRIDDDLVKENDLSKVSFEQYKVNKNAIKWLALQ